MNVYELANSRYATKKFNSERKIPQFKINELKEVLRMSPSSINVQPWKFTFVEDHTIKSALAEASYFNKEKIEQAPLLIVFSFAKDLEKFQKVVESELPENTVELYNDSRSKYGDEYMVHWFINQVYLSFGFAIASCAGLQLDSTPMEGIDQETYAKILGEDEYQPILALAVGYAAADDYNRPEVHPKSRRPMDEVIWNL